MAEQYEPSFTTSQEAAEEKKEEERPKGGWAKTVEGTASPTNSRVVISRPMVPVKPQVFEPAIRPLTPHQRRMLHHRP